MMTSERKISAQSFFNKSGMPLAISDTSVATDNQKLSMHNHDFEELVIVHSGSATHVCGGMECKISIGDVFFIPPKYYHGFYNFNNYGVINVLFIREKLCLPDDEIKKQAAYYALFELEPELRSGKGSAPALTLNNTELAHIKDIAQQIKNEHQFKKISYKYRASALFMELEVLLMRAYENIKSSTSTSLLNLGNFISFLEHNYKRKICIRDMAKAINTSERTLNRLCNEILGCSPQRYLMDLRLSKAKQMLHENKFNISRIAFDSGFSDSNYFSKQYKKKFLCTPRESRKNNNTTPQQ